MTQKKPKSPVLVISAIIFLLIFIILPPVFRVLIPKQDVSVTEVKETFILSCEKNSLEEGYKIMSKLIYEDNSPTKNTISYIKNNATGTENNNLEQGNGNNSVVEENGTVDSNVSGGNDAILIRTVTEEIEFFKAISGIKVNESESYTSVVITSNVVSSNNNNLELTNYFLSEDEQTLFFEERGFTCTKINL